jgi:hypothetical protein
LKIKKSSIRDRLKSIVNEHNSINNHSQRYTREEWSALMEEPIFPWDNRKIQKIRRIKKWRKKDESQENKNDLN